MAAEAKEPFPWWNWIFAGVVVLFVIIIVIGFVYYLGRDHESSQGESSFVSSNPLIWSNPTQTNTSRGPCSLYVYPGALLDFKGTTVWQPPTPSANPDVVNSLTPMDSNIPCVDFDQQILGQYSHVCQGETGETSLCRTITGQFASPGTVEVYYSSENCNAPNPCFGTLGLFGVNFGDNPPANTQCARPDDNNVIKVRPCDPSDSSQIFRISRVNPGVNPPTTLDPSNPNITTNGLLGQFLSRDPPGITGGAGPQCIVPVSNTVNSTLTLGPCPVPYVWALIRSFTSSQGTAPQQIAYVGGITAPYPTTGNSEDIANWITTNNVLSLSSNGDDLILTNYNFDAGSPSGRLQTASYLPYISYVANQNIPVCVGVPSGTCSSF